MEKVTEFDETFSASQILLGIKEKDALLVLSSIKSGENVNLRCKNTGMTFLHVIMKYANPLTELKYVPMVYMLSNANVDLDVVDNSGYSAFYMAIKGALLDLMVSLIKCGVSMDLEKDEEQLSKLKGIFNCDMYTSYKKFAPGYWDAVENNKVFKVNTLVKSWCKINISRGNKTLIEYAKEKNACDKIIKMLIQNEATIELAHATIAGDEENMRYLLMHHSVDTKTKDLSHRESFFEPYSPMSLYGAGIKYGHKHILQLLKNIEDGTEIIKKDVPGPGSVRSSSVCILL